jgi:hypothetical protein
MLRLCAERFCNCIFLQQQQQLPFLQCTWSFILSFGMWVMTETYWFTNANTQGDHRGIEFTCQSVWHCQEKATAEKSSVRNIFSHRWERLSRIINQFNVYVCSQGWRNGKYVQFIRWLSEKWYHINDVEVIILHGIKELLFLVLRRFGWNREVSCTILIFYINNHKLWASKETNSFI